jgi:hypothetical protein
VPTTPTVDVIGLRALVRDANRLCADAGPLNEALKAAGRTAAEPVAAAARSAYPQRTGDLAGTVRVGATRSGASVRVGSAKVPYAAMVDFGGYPPKGGSSAYPYIQGGRYLYPAAEQWASTAAELYSVAAQRAFASFSWTNETTDAAAVHD